MFVASNLKGGEWAAHRAMPMLILLDNLPLISSRLAGDIFAGALLSRIRQLARPRQAVQGPDIRGGRRRKERLRSAGCFRRE